jgi:hypothetical protein
MATDFAFRKKAMKELPTSTGVYVLCDLDEVRFMSANPKMASGHAYRGT